jgi:putative transposase
VAGGGRVENFAMQRFQSYKFELRPTGPQQRQMRRIASCCRFVFNGALAVQMKRRDLGIAPLDYAALNSQLAQWRRRPESTWLADVPIECPQQSLRNLERAFARYHRSQSQYPVYKRRGGSDSFYYAKSNEIRIDSDGQQGSFAKTRLATISQQLRDPRAHSQRYHQRCL